jgi:hypothetical protein
MWQMNTKKLRPPHKMLSFQEQFRIVGFILLTAFCLLQSVFAQGGVKGKIRATNGSGIANATITARQEGKDLKTVRSDSKGNFVLDGLRSGVYNIVFDADGYAAGVKFGVEVKNGKTMDLGDRLILGVDQGSLVLIKGAVFFKEGFSVTGAKIELEQVNADGSAKNIGSSFSSVSGEFSFRQPNRDGKYRVTAKYKGVTGSKEVSVDNPGIYRVAITLDISKADK